MARALIWRETCGVFPRLRLLRPAPLLFAPRFGHNLDNQFVGSADDRHFRANPYLSLSEQPMQRVDPGHWLPPEFHDHVAPSQARLLRLTACLHRTHSPAPLAR